MRFSKSLGQVFIKKNFYIQKILDSIDIDNEEVVEIGSGEGKVSEFLAKKAKLLWCVELDKRFAKVLEAKFSSLHNVKIVCSDILKFRFDTFENKVVVFGNIPYQISNSLIRYLIKNRDYIKRAYLTLQKEFAEKLVAKPSTKQYCFLTCFVNYYCFVEKLFDIPAIAFFPKPSVNSSFVKLEFTKQPVLSRIKEELLFKVIKKAFIHRRKKLINSLPFLRDRLDVLEILKISKDARAENVSLENYVALVDKIYNDYG